MPPKTASKSSPVSYVKFSDKLTDSLQDITRMINEHKDMIDTIQEVALELTSTFGSLHTLMVKYAAQANKILDILLPIAKSLPVIPKNVTALLVDMEKYTQKIIDNNQTTAKTISDVQSGLKSGDVSRLKGHTGDLKKLSSAIAGILPK
jgi:hypothetical protein